MSEATLADRADARERMVQAQIADRGVGDPAVLEAMRTVPREAFVPSDITDLAYDDTALPIGEGQTVSQPYVVALMTELAQLQPADRVLDVGAGSGYATAVLARIAAEVYGIERHPALAREAVARLRALGVDNATVVTGDGTLGLPDAAPFDAILVAAGGPEVPTALKEQLAVGGRLVIPVGLEERRQTLVRVTRTGEDTWEREDVGAVAFVPLVGAQGWLEDDPSGPGR